MVFGIETMFSSLETIFSKPETMVDVPLAASAPSITGLTNNFTFLPAPTVDLKAVQTVPSQYSRRLFSMPSASRSAAGPFLASSHLDD